MKQTPLGTCAYQWLIGILVSTSTVVHLRLSFSFCQQSLVSHDRLELLVWILHVAETEVQAIHERLVVDAPVGREHVEGIAVLQRTEAERVFARERHASWAPLALQVGEHKLLGVGWERRCLLLLRRRSSQAKTVERMHGAGDGFLLEEAVDIQTQVGGRAACDFAAVSAAVLHLGGAELGLQRTRRWWRLNAGWSVAWRTGWLPPTGQTAVATASWTRMRCPPGRWLAWRPEPPG